ncbi:MAG: hypothetical protein IH587_04450, partial [Anaerolineae bacterium]|nr:hypothetical protein [Anaerolineae bacterium]
PLLRRLFRGGLIIFVGLCGIFYLLSPPQSRNLGSTWTPSFTPVPATRVANQPFATDDFTDAPAIEPIANTTPFMMMTAEAIASFVVGTQFALTGEPSPTPRVTLEQRMSDAYAELEGVVSVDLVRIRGSDVYSEVTVFPAYNNQNTAERMHSATGRVLGTAFYNFSTALTDQRYTIDYRWDSRVDSWFINNRSITPIATAPPVQAFMPPPVSSPYTCNGIDDLNCDDFSSVEEANAHLFLCGVDEDRLDQGGIEGVACEDTVFP